jgi:hypothetical protein
MPNKERFALINQFTYAAVAQEAGPNVRGKESATACTLLVIAYQLPDRSQTGDTLQGGKGRSPWVGSFICRT